VRQVRFVFADLDVNVTHNVVRGSEFR
jgi:hypothetical protein